MSRRDEAQRRHEYMLKEIRLTGEDVKADVKDDIRGVEKRVRSLEHWRWMLSGAFGGICAWFKFGGK